MVLLIAVEKTVGRNRSSNDIGYALALPTGNVAVVCKDPEHAVPTAEEVSRELKVTEHPVPPPFFVFPFDGLVDDRLTTPNMAAFNWIFEDVTQSVARRKNVTIIHRGENADLHLENVLISFLESVRTSAEYGMQVVADEIAKEKQMQRLLQLDADGEDGAKMAPSGLNDDASDVAHDAAKGIPLSRNLRKQVAALREKYRYIHPSDRQAAVAHRYNVISAAHDEVLEPPCTSGSYLLPEAFKTIMPGQRSICASANGGQQVARSGRSHTIVYNQMHRRSTISILEELKNDGADIVVQPLAGNGWPENIPTYTFDGETSVMALPGVPRFEDLIREFALDFWIRTDLSRSDGKRVLLQIMEGQRDDLGQLFQLSLNWYEDMPDSLRVLIRDSGNRVLEAVAQLSKTGVTEGTHFHHLLLRVKNLDEGQLMCEVDGIDIPVQLIQQEHPIAFNPWPHRLFVGGFLDEENTPRMVFRGTIMELRFWNVDGEPKPVVRWPLLGTASGTLLEATRTIPVDHHETLLGLRLQEEPAPKSSPYFDGRLVINAGTMSLLGELMHNWRIEIRVRTTVSNQMMSVLGVTDSKFKMQEIGIVLNAEPIISKERFRYHELHTAFYVVDAFGACCSALLRGTERQNLMDGEWHTIVWRCIDSEANKYSIKVDGVLQDILFVCREGPTRFVSFDDWICVGGHNVRNWKVKRPFIGQICRLYISLRGYRYATLDMQEGPGAYVLQDRSGHGNHGLLINCATNVVRSNDTIWMPVPLPVSTEEEGGIKMDIVIFEHNQVSISAVVFTCEFDEVKVPREAVYDVFSKRLSVLEAAPHLLESHRKLQWKGWYDVPEACFRQLDSITRLEESINEILKADTPRGHLMVTVRIGDCLATVLHLRDPELPPDAVYDCNMLKWHYPYMIEGMHGRRELLLNRMIEGMETVLMTDTLRPYTTAQLGPINAGSTPIVSDDIVRSLQDSGRPWFLPVTLHAHLLNAQYGSSLHLIHHIPSQMSRDEAASISLFNKRLSDGVQEKASLLIQRTWRGRMAKMEAGRRQERRAQQLLKLEEIRTLRMNRNLQMKSQLTALVVTLHTPQCEGVLPISTDVTPLIEALTLQGYEVTHLEEPDLATLIRAVAQVDTEKSNFIYVSGYGGAMNLRQPPIFGFECLALDVEQEAVRTTLGCEQTDTFHALMTRFKEEKLLVVSKKKKKASKSANTRTARPKKISEEEAELARRQLESAQRSDRLLMEQEESFGRDELVRDYETVTQLISREMRKAIVSTQEYVRCYHAKGPQGDPQNFVYPVQSQMINPYASTVMDVEDLIRAALHSQLPLAGLQSIVALDLHPITGYSRGVACLASSTGMAVRIPYKPQQQGLLTLALVKAFNGQLPRISASSKYAILSGGIETSNTQRDWKSFATYIVSQLRPACNPERYSALCAELDREVPFMAELVPIRCIPMTPELKDRRRREREGQKVVGRLLFGVGSVKVQSDMFSLFRSIVDDVPLTEISFINAVNVLLTNQCSCIDTLDSDSLSVEVEKCRPSGCAVPFEIQLTANGALVSFPTAESTDKMHVSQWVSNMGVRSLTWQIKQRGWCGSRRLEVDYVEYLYQVKITCNMRRFRQLYKQMCTTPVPQTYIRLLEVTQL